MHKGYVKLWRKSKPMLKNHNLWIFWSWCLMTATHKDCRIWMTKGRRSFFVDLKAGQLVFSIHDAVENTGLSSRSVRTCIKSLKSTSMATIETTSNYTLLSIMNWDIYQSLEDVNDKPNDKQTTSKRQANDKPIKQEHKHIRNKEHIYTPKKTTRKKRETIPFGEFENVQLTSEEFERLKDKFGETILEKCIQKLDWQIERKGYKSKNHNLCIQDWVIKAVMESENRTKTNGSYLTAQEKRDYALQNSLSDIYNEIYRIQQEKTKLIGEK